jgi:glutamate formiminotransferase
MKLIECIPNFSEGRDRQIIHQIVDAIQAIEGVMLLDISSDADHNRTVMTFAGTPLVVREAAFQGIATAARLIDLDQHQGVHPRIGAADVVPFVPLRDASMSDCVEIARALGQRVADELQLPVYLYEAAALTPEKRNLAKLRRDPYERLKTTIQSDPLRRPDYGPARLTAAGAVAIGAREPLIAFNAYLDTDDVTVAQAVAVAVRESGGGLPHLKALGLLVDGQAQVSMNVINFRETSLHTILERVREEAAKHSATITHTELVGLVPRAALIESALEALQLPAQVRDLVLEARLGAASDDYSDVNFG